MAAETTTTIITAIISFFAGLLPTIYDFLFKKQKQSEDYNTTLLENLIEEGRRLREELREDVEKLRIKVSDLEAKLEEKEERIRTLEEENNKLKKLLEI